MFPNNQEFALKVIPVSEPPTTLFTEASVVTSARPASQNRSDVNTVSAKKKMPQYDPAGGEADAPL